MMQALVLPYDNVVRIKYNNDKELSNLLEALANVPALDVKVNGSER